MLYSTKSTLDMYSMSHKRSICAYMSISVLYDAVISWSSTTADVAGIIHVNQGVIQSWLDDFWYCLLLVTMALVVLGHSVRRSITVAALWPWLYKFRWHNYSALPKTQWSGAKGTGVVDDKVRGNITKQRVKHSHRCTFIYSSNWFQRNFICHGLCRVRAGVGSGAVVKLDLSQSSLVFWPPFLSLAGSDPRGSL